MLQGKGQIVSTTITNKKLKNLRKDLREAIKKCFLNKAGGGEKIKRSAY